MTTKKKSKAKIHKALVMKHEELAVDKHLVDVRYEVHGPKDALPPLPVPPIPELAHLPHVPVEITKKAAPKTPEKHWYDFLTDW
jgi:hypothetical protein